MGPDAYRTRIPSLLAPTPLACSSEPPPPSRQRLGPRYVFQALLGAGGMGTVYRVHDVELDEIVALKLLHRELADEMIARFRREVKLARRVTHHNVVRTYDIGQHGDEHYLTMEFIQGESLATLLERERRLSVAQVASLGIAVCAGLEAAHTAGVIHRDLKPENVLVEQGSRVVITDFGISCMYANAGGTLREHGIVGTPLYMAPEQLELRAEHDARTDIYALGAVLYHLVCGVSPWPASSQIHPLLARLRGDEPDVDLLRHCASPALATVILRCLQRDPIDRFGSADELARALLPLRAASEPDALAEQHAPSLRAHRSRGFSPRTLAARERTRKSVLVLPLRNRGPAPDRFVAEGLTEDLADVLCGIPKLRVQASTQTPPDAQTDPPTLGRAHGVDVVVDGHVERDGDDFRVAVRLHTSRNGIRLWAARFRAPVRQLFELSDEIGRAVAERLTLSCDARIRRPPTDARAMDAYLRGRAALQNVWPSSLQDAVSHLRRARELAPRDPTILAAYARATARSWFWTGSAADGRAARSAARSALALAPSSAEARLALAGVSFMRNRHGRALRWLAEALAASPGLPEPRELRGRILLELGEIEQGMYELGSAASLDHRYAQPIELCRGYALVGRWDEVESTLKNWRYAPAERSARGIVCARLALWAPEPERLRALAPPLESIEEPGREYVRLASELIRKNRIVSDEARAILRRYAEAARGSRRYCLLIHQLSAEAYAYAGELGFALEHIVTAAKRGLTDLGWLERCPLLAPLHVVPEFRQARQRVAKRAERALSGVRSESERP
jgi:serine/threonine-protein kinase